jgi:hypothetical protein
VVILAAARDWRATIALSFAGTAGLAVVAIGDLVAERPGVAAVEGVLAIAALLISIAAVVARER